MKVRPTTLFFADTVFEVMNCAYSHAAAVLSASWSAKKVQEPTSWYPFCMPCFQYGPFGPGAMRHFGVPSAFTTGRPGLIMSAVKAVYQKICCAIWPCAGTGPASPKVMPEASFGAYFFIQSTYLVSA